jgi:flagellar protein FliS
MSTSRGVQAYRRTQAESSTPLERVVLLYDGAIRFLTAAGEAFDRGDSRGRATGVSRALAILTELQNTLDMQQGGELSKNLDALYDYVIGRLLDATAKGDRTAVDEAIRLLSTVREAWAQIAAQPVQRSLNA